VVAASIVEPTSDGDWVPGFDFQHPYLQFNSHIN